MDKIDTFTFTGGLIEFKEENPTWCKIFLERESEKLFLGADSKEVIKTKFLSVLTGERNDVSSNFSIEGNKVIWIISLLETYTTIFLFRGPDRDIFYCLYKDRPVEEFDKIILSKKERDQFLMFLKELQ